MRWGEELEAPVRGQRSNYVGEMGISGNMRNDSRSSLNNGEELINWAAASAAAAHAFRIVARGVIMGYNIACLLRL